MDFLGIIPARFQSTRLPGKPLAEINGKPMIQWVYERSKIALTDVYVATDDERIAKVVESFKGHVVMTSPEHLNGTSRCLEALEKISKQNKKSFDVVVNIQGDEPMLEPDCLKTLQDCFLRDDVNFATLAQPIINADDLNGKSDVWLVMNNQNEAMYFSRSLIPFVRNLPRENWIQAGCHFRHIGIYAYTPEALKSFAQMKPSILENMESLEQLRWLENGGKIKVGLTPHRGISVDTPEDLDCVRQLLTSIT